MPRLTQSPNVSSNLTYSKSPSYHRKNLYSQFKWQSQLMKLNNWTKVLLVFFCLIASILGFLIKLPSVFRHFDKELHSAFYFLAAGFLNILFANGKLFRHILIFVILYLFGVAIEFAQEYSNSLLHSRIHGRYDPEDVKYNLKGLIAFSVIWICYKIGMTVYNKTTFNRSKNNL